MHILTPANRFQLSLNKTLEAGAEYIADDVAAAQLLVACNGGTMRPLEERRPFDENKDWNRKKLLFFRMGGFGDLVLLTPVLREVKRRWPSAQVHVATMDRYAPALSNLPEVCDGAVMPPLELEKAKGYDAWIFYENAIERNPLANKVHMTDLFAQIAGITGDFDKKPAYALTEKERIWAQEGYPREGSQRRLGVQVAARAQSRTYPPELLGKVINEVLAKGWEVFLFGVKGQINVTERAGVRNLADAGLTFRQSCAVLAYCDCVLAPDSALLHVAGALDVPAVGLYGPFPWKLRTAYCPTTFAIQGEGACAPCFFHEVPRQLPFPVNGPCIKTGKCEVLASIKPERIVQKIEQVAKKFELSAV